MNYLDLTLSELKSYCYEHSIEVTGDKRKKQSYIEAIELYDRLADTPEADQEAISIAVDDNTTPPKVTTKPVESIQDNHNSSQMIAVSLFLYFVSALVITIIFIVTGVCLQTGKGIRYLVNELRRDWNLEPIPITGG